MSNLRSLGLVVALFSAACVAGDDVGDDPEVSASDGKADGAAGWMATGRAHSQLGTATAVADLNGDGYSDLLLSDLGRDAVLVYLGSARGLPRSPSQTVRGEPDSLFGAELVVAGDLDADGRADVLIGSRDARPVQLFHGSADGLAETSSWTKPATGQGEDVSQSWAFASGDFDGDGSDEILVADSEYSTDAAPAQGAAFAFRPGARTPVWRAQGAGEFAAFGTALAVLDVNGDQHADAVIGAPGQAAATDPRGALEVYLGGADGLARTATRIQPTSAGTTQLGLTVASAGDVDGDGLGDVLATRFDSDDVRLGLYLGQGAGLSSSPAAELALAPRLRTDYAQAAIGVGDADGDGHGDILVSEIDFENRGRVRLYAGRADGLATRAAWTRRGAGGGAFGKALAAGDFDGDGAIDHVVAEPELTVTRSGGRADDAGRVHVFLGKDR
jgi:hypothetical protein